jgi:hypothetical protein
VIPSYRGGTRVAGRCRTARLYPQQASGFQRSVASNRQGERGAPLRWQPLLAGPAKRGATTSSRADRGPPTSWPRRGPRQIPGRPA